MSGILDKGMIDHGITLILIKILIKIDFYKDRKFLYIKRS